MIRIKYFAVLRDRFGCDEEQVAPEAGLKTVAQIRAHLVARGEPWSILADAGRFKAARNLQLVSEAEAIDAGDELAFLPPVTGG